MKIKKKKSPLPRQMFAIQLASGELGKGRFETKAQVAEACAEGAGLPVWLRRDGVTLPVKNL